MVDWTKEQTMTLAAAAALPMLPLGRSGKRPHASTLTRWATNGVRGVKLETIRFGGARCTSHEAIVRFVERLTEPARDPNAPTKSQQRKSHEQADRFLQNAGM